MSRTVGIPPGFINKLDPDQRKFIITAVGRAFYDEFLTAHGKHLFVFGTTGSGKTNKGYAFLDWLKHLETQIWISSGKTGETLPLLCMDRKVQIVVPDGCDVIIEERVNGRWQQIPDHPKVIPVPNPRAMLESISPGSWKNGNRVRDTITILEIRNAFSRRVLAVQWIAELFEEIAVGLREGWLTVILPATIHIDESQWTLAGQRISNDADRSRASEVIAENSLECRSGGLREILYAQGHNNIPPTARENMLFHCICRGGDVRPEENRKLAEWCRYAPQRNPPSPQYFATDQGRFVFESNHNGWGDSYPPTVPWRFRLYPLRVEDRNWIRKCRVRYVGKHDQKPIESEAKEECLPELGRFSALAIQPEKTDPGPAYNRWNSDCIEGEP